MLSLLCHTSSLLRTLGYNTKHITLFESNLKQCVVMKAIVSYCQIDNLQTCHQVCIFKSVRGNTFISSKNYHAIFKYVRIEKNMTNSSPHFQPQVYTFE